MPPGWRVTLKNGLGEAGEERGGKLLHLGMQRISVRVHGDNRRKIFDADAPHRLGRAQLEQIHSDVEKSSAVLLAKLADPVF